MNPLNLLTETDISQTKAPLITYYITCHFTKIHIIMTAYTIQCIKQRSRFTIHRTRFTIHRTRFTLRIYVRNSNYLLNTEPHIQCTTYIF